MKRVYNFCGGPATFPESVLKKVASEFLSYQGLGRSIMEVSHRSKVVATLVNDTKARLRKHLKLDESTHIFFLQGGATTDFLRIPYNLIASKEESIDHIVTGLWSKQAAHIAGSLARVHIAGSSEDKKFTYIPKGEQLQFQPESRYVFLCSNNTVFGTQFHEYPETNGVPLIVDSTSDLFTREVDYNRFDMFFASAQKNLGPAGCTILCIKDHLLEQTREDIPDIISYRKNIAANSVLNTAPVFIIYFINEVLKWMDEEGGVPVLEKRNRAKTNILYECLDAHPSIYHPTARKEDRSMVNVTWHLSTDALTEKFLTEAEEHDLVELRGNPQNGGIRASSYNAQSLEAIEKLADFIKKFARANA